MFERSVGDKRQWPWQTTRLVLTEGEFNIPRGIIEYESLGSEGIKRNFIGLLRVIFAAIKILPGEGFNYLPTDVPDKTE